MVGSSLAPAITVDANLREAMRAYGRSTAEGESREYPGVSIAASGIDYSVFNSAMLTSPVDTPAELERRLAQAAVHFTARGFGWTWWLCEEWLSPELQSKADRHFEAAGMRVLTSAPGMYAERISTGRPARSEVVCRAVTDSRTRYDFLDVASVIFLLPFRIAQVIYGGQDYWNETTRGYVAYVKEKPVSIVTTVSAAGATGIYSLGTLPQHQRHGFGETLMRFALADTAARTGNERSVLQATSSGLPLYRKLGYRIVTRFRVFDRPAGDPR